MTSDSEKIEQLQQYISQSLEEMALRVEGAVALSLEMASLAAHSAQILRNTDTVDNETKVHIADLLNVLSTHIDQSANLLESMKDTAFAAAGIDYVDRNSQYKPSGN